VEGRGCSSEKVAAVSSDRRFASLSYFEDPSTRWPDFTPAMPMHPAVVAITKQGGGRIG
jgi:secreted PhoX family phosphatase